MTETIVTKKELEDIFYSKPYFISYSALNKLLYSPSIFYKHYVLGEKEESTDKHLVAGKVIHCLLLDDHMFDSQFIVSPARLPGGDGAKAVVKCFYEKYKEKENNGVGELTLKDFSAEILDILKEINLHQKLKTDEQRLEKMFTEEFCSYFEHLKKAQGKALLDQDTLDFCKKAVDTVRNNEQVSNLLKLNLHETDNVDVINEQLLECNLPNFPFGIKGIIDNIVIDHDNKTIRINDLKTSGRSLLNFQESVEYYNYGLQAAMYYNLVKQIVVPQIAGSENWPIIFNFVVIDTFQQVYAFEVSDETMTKWLDELRVKLIEAQYHYNQRDYRLPYPMLAGQLKL
jgi:hypothetical protein